MSMQQGDYSDAGLLQVCGSLREAADVIAKHVADHGASHDHPLVECLSASLVVAEVLVQIGGMSSVNGASMLEAAMTAMGFPTTE